MLCVFSDSFNATVGCIFPGVGLEFRVESVEEGPVLVRQRRRVEDVLEAARGTPRPRRWRRRDLKGNKMQNSVNVMNSLPTLG